MRVLIASNHDGRADELRGLLSQQNFNVDVVASTAAAMSVLDDNGVSLCVVDGDLTDGPGIQLVQTLRAADYGLPTVYFTTHDTDQHKIDALDMGVDEVLNWPIGPQMLLAQIRSLLRRCGPGESAMLKYEDLKLDLRSLKVTRGDQVMRTTSREIAVLEYLMRHPERVIVRSELIDSVWDRSLPPESNVVEVFIARLRRKIDRPFERQLIHTIVGRGYMLSHTKPGEERLSD